MKNKSPPWPVVNYISLLACWCMAMDSRTNGTDVNDSYSIRVLWIDISSPDKRLYFCHGSQFLSVQLSIWSQVWHWSHNCIIYSYTFVLKQQRVTLIQKLCFSLQLNGVYWFILNVWVISNSFFLTFGKKSNYANKHTHVNSQIV